MVYPLGDGTSNPLAPADIRLFIIEGMCTVVLAVGLYFVLPNRVDDCKWLNAEEKTAIWDRKSAGTAADPLARKFEWHYISECLKGELAAG